MNYKDRQLLEESYEQVYLTEGFMDWLQGLMASDYHTVWGAIKMYAGSAILHNLVGLGVGVVKILVICLLVVGLVARDKFEDIMGKLLQTAKGKKIKEIVEKYQKDPEVMELIKVLRSAKEDPSKEGIAMRKDATKRLNELISAELGDSVSRHPAVASEIQKRSFSHLKHDTRLPESMEKGGMPPTAGEASRAGANPGVHNADNKVMTPKEMQEFESILAQYATHEISAEEAAQRCKDLYEKSTGQSIDQY